MVVLDQGNLMDALMSHPATRRFAQVKREQSQLKIGRMRYASQSLLKYHQHLLHFLAWCEYRGQAEGHFGRFSWEHLTAYRKAGVNAVGSLEDYERDQTDKRRPDLRSASPSQVLTRIGVANSFLVFCTATGYRQKAFSPYLATANKSYLDRHELRHEHWEIPEVEDLAEWVRSQVSLRNRVAAGLIVFGGLRVQDMLPLQRGDIPKFLDAKPIGAWRVGIPVFGKGGKWRTTSIPKWVYEDLLEFVGPERRSLREYWISRGRHLPMGRDAPVFVSTKKPNFGRSLSRVFLDDMTSRSIIEHPHNGRHAFAYWRLIELLAQRAEALAKTPMTVLMEAGMVQSELEILRFEMGHSRTSTTEGYLKYAQSRIGNDRQFHEMLNRLNKVHLGEQA